MIAIDGNVLVAVRVKHFATSNHALLVHSNSTGNTTRLQARPGGSNIPRCTRQYVQPCGTFAYLTFRRCLLTINSVPTSQVVVFTILAPLSVGAIRSIDIGFATDAHSATGYTDTMTGEEWLLSNVEVADMTTGLTAVFDSEQWMNADRPRIKLIPVSVHYLPESEVGQAASAGMAILCMRFYHFRGQPPVRATRGLCRCK